jgi:hypothetical protein
MLNRLKELQAIIEADRAVVDAMSNLVVWKGHVLCDGGEITLPRVNAFKAINQERLYQDGLSKYGLYKDTGIEGEDWTPAEWISFIEDYIQKAKHDLTGCENAAAGRTAQMDTMRKIAALAVAAMENCGIEERLPSKGGKHA